MWTKRMHRFERKVAEKLERHPGLISNRVLDPVGDSAGDKDGNLHIAGWNHQEYF